MTVKQTIRVLTVIKGSRPGKAKEKRRKLSLLVDGFFDSVHD